jgi:hypothetical protein
MHYYNFFIISIPLICSIARVLSDGKMKNSNSRKVVFEDFIKTIALPEEKWPGTSVPPVDGGKGHCGRVGEFIPKMQASLAKGDCPQLEQNVKQANLETAPDGTLRMVGILSDPHFALVAGTLKHFALDDAWTIPINVLRDNMQDVQHVRLMSSIGSPQTTVVFVMGNIGSQLVRQKGYTSWANPPEPFAVPIKFEEDVEALSGTDLETENSAACARWYSVAHKIKAAGDLRVGAFPLLSGRTFCPAAINTAWDIVVLKVEQRPISFAGRKINMWVETSRVRLPRSGSPQEDPRGFRKGA